MTVIWETTKVRDNLPRLGYAMPEVTPSASSSAAGYGAALAVNGDTFDAWKPTSVPATLQVTFDELTLVNYVAIGAHTLDQAGASAVIETWNGTTWTEVPGSAVAPTSGDPIFWLIKDVLALAVRVEVTDAIAEIGVFKAGAVTTFTPGRRADYLGMVGRDAREVEYMDNMSVTGEKLGRTIKSDGLSFPFSVSHLPETWASAVWPGLLDHCLGDDGFFLAPRPSQYPNECYYAWTQGIPRLERTMPNARMSRTLSMQLRGYRRP